MAFHRIAEHRLTGCRCSRKRGAGEGRRGNAVLEFALVITVAVPLLFGTISLGITFGRGIQTVQVTRDVGHMYGLGVDFTSPGAQNLVNKLGRGFDLSPSGNAVLIFSQIVSVYQADCDAAGLSNRCTNLNQPVFAQRIVIGNSSLRSSAFGTPPAQYIDSQGNIAPSDYYQQSSLVANGFSSVLAQNDGDVAFVVEGFFTMPDLNFLQIDSAQTNQGTYVREIF